MRLGSPKGVESAESRSRVLRHVREEQAGMLLGARCGDARRVAGMLDIPFYVLNFEEDFGRVIDYFVAEYNRGRTPNPCVRCNDWLKFGKLAQYAEAVGADYVASGHYARAESIRPPARRRLLRGTRSSQGSELRAVRHEPRDAGSHAAADRRI